MNSGRMAQPTPGEPEEPAPEQPGRDADRTERAEHSCLKNQEIHPKGRSSEGEQRKPLADEAALREREQSCEREGQRPDKMEGDAGDARVPAGKHHIAGEWPFICAEGGLRERGS